MNLIETDLQKPQELWRHLLTEGLREILYAVHYNRLIPFKQPPHHASE